MLELELDELLLLELLVELLLVELEELEVLLELLLVEELELDVLELDELDENTPGSTNTFASVPSHIVHPNSIAVSNIWYQPLGAHSSSGLPSECFTHPPVPTGRNDSLQLLLISDHSNVTLGPPSTGYHSQLQPPTQSNS